MELTIQKTDGKRGKPVIWQLWAGRGKELHSDKELPPVLLYRSERLADVVEVFRFIAGLSAGEDAQRARELLRDAE